VLCKSIISSTGFIVLADLFMKSFFTIARMEWNGMEWNGMEWNGMG